MLVPLRTSRPSGSAARAAAASLAAVGALAVTMATATPAEAASYKCTTSKKSIDQANYNGPWADNWDFKTTLCAKKSGSYVYAYAKISWDGPVGGVDNRSIYDGAYFQLQIKKSQSGTDPVKVKKNHGLESRLENSDSNGNYNGSYTTGTIKWKAGKAKAVADGTLYLDWHKCCGGHKAHGFSASPRV